MKHLAKSPLQLQRTSVQRVGAIFCALLLFVTYGFAQAPLAEQVPPPPDQPPALAPAPPDRLLPPEALNNLVAPVALYPDNLLGQVLAASTYPLEVAEAGQ